MNINKLSSNKLTSAILLSGLVSTSAFATNGYFSHGFNAQEKGMGGAGVALATNSLSAATNPANILDLDDRIDAGFSLFSPKRSYFVEGSPSIPAGTTPVIGGISSCAAPGVTPCAIPFAHNEQAIDSDKNYFVIPNFGWVTKLSSDTSFAFAAYGNGGMNSEYHGGTARVFDPNSNTIVDAPGSFGDGTAGVDLSQLFLNSTFAYQASDTVSLGASVIVAVQAFAATGLGPFANFSLAPDKMTDNGHDIAYGAGIKLGANFKVSENLSFAASYQSKISMSEFDDYAGLFADSGKVDIPSTYTIGLAWDTSDSSTLLLDYQEIFYTDSAAISNPIGSLMNGSCVDALNNTLFSGMPSTASGAGCLGGSQGAGFGWEDISVIKLGYQWGSDDHTYRVGFSTTDHPIPPSEVNINLISPGIMEDHFTLGYTNATTENEWTIFLMYAPEISISATSQFDGNQSVGFKMHQLEVGLDYQF